VELIQQINIKLILLFFDLKIIIIGSYYFISF